MRPLRDNIIVKRLPTDLTTPSGLILKTSDEPDRAEVTALGSQVTEVSVGEVIALNWNKATQIGNDEYILPITEVVFVYE